MSPQLHFSPVTEKEYGLDKTNIYILYIFSGGGGGGVKHFCAHLLFNSVIVIIFIEYFTMCVIVLTFSLIHPVYR